MDTDLLFRLICAAVVLVMLIYYLKRQRKIASFLFGAFTGTAALLLLNEYGGAIGVTIQLNLFNLAGSAVLGVPFVIFLVIMNFL